MGNFNKFGRDRGGRGFGGGGFGGGRKFGGGPRQMHQATCSKCGAGCEVPFKPTGERPVFCNNCFKSQSGPAPRFGQKSFGGGHRQAALGGNFGGNLNTATAVAVSKDQFNSLSVKLDQILAMLNGVKAGATPKAQTVEVKNKKEAVRKERAVAKKAKSKKK